MHYCQSDQTVLIFVYYFVFKCIILNGNFNFQIKLKYQCAIFTPNTVCQCILLSDCQPWTNGCCIIVGCVKWYHNIAVCVRVHFHFINVHRTKAAHTHDTISIDTIAFFRNWAFPIHSNLCDRYLRCISTPKYRYTNTSWVDVKTCMPTIAVGELEFDSAWQGSFKSALQSPLVPRAVARLWITRQIREKLQIIYGIFRFSCNIKTDIDIWILLITPCLLTWIREFIHTQQYHVRPKAKRGMAMLSVDKFSYPRKQPRGSEFIQCSNNICHIPKRFQALKSQLSFNLDLITA